MQTTWTNVDRYFEERFNLNDEVLTQVLHNCEANGLPQYQVTAAQGKLLHLYARMCNAKRILEIGTLGGYSAIWFARSFQNEGTVVTIEADTKHAETATQNFELAGLKNHIQLIQNDARAALQELIAQKAEPFDLIFIDADKPSNPIYLELTLKLSKPGTVIIFDNVVRDGEVSNGESADQNVLGTRKLCGDLANNPSLSSTAIQTVGSKGYDGFSLTIVE
jgi:predicted O-methyltransferase YrrM